MAVSPTHLRIVVDRRAEVMKNIEMLAQAQVLVGIPKKNIGRNEPNVPNNAVIAYAHEFGDPKKNLPARPFMRPGIRSKMPQIRSYLVNASKSAVKGDQDGMLSALRAAGQTGASGVQGKITSGPFVPLSPRTILARLRKTQSGQARIRRMTRAGQDIVAWGQANLKPLIDTGQMRAAITYVLRLRGRDVP